MENEAEVKKVEEVRLDDHRRIKSLSPGRLVFKRFTRNRLAVVGSVILLAILLYSIIGPFISPYGESEIFETFRIQSSNYAVGYYRAEEESQLFRFAPNLKISGAGYPAALGSLITSFEDTDDLVGTDATFGGNGADAKYRIRKLGVDGADITRAGVYLLFAAPRFEIGARRSNNAWTFVDVDSAYNNDDFKSAAEGVPEQSSGSFSYGGGTVYYTMTIAGSWTTYSYFGYASSESEFGILSNLVLNKIDAGFIDGEIPEDFRARALKSLYDAAAPSLQFVYKSQTYTVNVASGGTEVRLDGRAVAEITNFAVTNPTGADIHTYEFKRAFKSVVDEIIADGGGGTKILICDAAIEDEETLKPVEGEKEFLVKYDVNRYKASTDMNLRVINTFASPSAEHWLGTDASGMDVFTRTMYGGRISLMAGIIVVLIELLIGVLLGGLAGYFGKWVDMLVMRIIDVFSCVPTTPILIALGAFFSLTNVAPMTRLMAMMAVIGILGWPGVAHLVRGQILTLREREFMLAAEATGINVWRRIFKHLVPNVIPQLIVTATMGVGGVILLESTLSFLGLGAQHPLATWGSMITSVNSAFGLTHYMHIWIPVGVLISLTVVAFNFIGDGLRDAFDPRMKR